jgi:type I restriction enzyme M protein
MFYNTGIATYIWVLTNRKPEHRKGKVQLIDATQWYRPLRKNLGKKNCELSDEDIQRICDAFLAFKESEQSKISPNGAFGYWKVTVERPLRLTVDLNQDSIESFRKVCKDAGEEQLAKLINEAAGYLGQGPHNDFNAFLNSFEAMANRAGLKLTSKRLKLIQNSLARRDETAVPVIKKIHKAGKVEANPLNGIFEATLNGKLCVVEYEPDTELRDAEQVPLLEEGGIEAFIRREVLPHAADAWIDESSIKKGYEVSFTRYFYKPQPLRSLEEIRADILALEKETEGLLEEIIGRGER